MIENLWGQIVLIAYFIPIFAVGMAGNLWVIVSLLRILYRGRWSPANNTFQHMAMYILSLSIADVAVLCMVPMLLGYFLDGHWRFGLFGCKVFFTVENINKLLSVAILTVMSFERFAAVSRPFRRRLYCRIFPRRSSSHQHVMWVVFCLLITSVFLCSPIIYYAELKPLQLSYDDGSSESSTQMVCGSDLPDHVMSFFICYMFVLGFVLPLFFISLCYFFLIQHLRKASANFECWPRGQGMFVTACLTKVVRSVLRVVGFHMICWGPFWVFVLIPIIEYFQLSQLPRALDSEFSRNIRMVSSFLPYLNSAGNWIFYAAMNREMRDTVTVLWPSSANNHNNNNNNNNVPSAGGASIALTTMTPVGGSLRGQRPRRRV
ncbi:hypothetical protein niasHS_008972 [Heterodera schachtii]|uniref:G-protein coupled receptors family 1 profile domain-containing protein n=1 Tax=Heterodera schachtii TaxID=97005 RepID=A0ABD2J5H7_HETSC